MTWLAKTILAIVVALVAFQFVPFGHDHSNPPPVAEPNWTSPAVQSLYQRACFDCHSNQTTWPWYSHLAPVSWMVQRDVNDGRRHLNFSTWNTPQRHASHIAQEITSGDMPLWFYLPMHPAARLSPAEKAEMVAAAAATFGPQSSPGERH